MEWEWDWQVIAAWSNGWPLLADHICKPEVKDKHQAANINTECNEDYWETDTKSQKGEREHCDFFSFVEKINMKCSIVNNVNMKDEGRTFAASELAFSVVTVGKFPMNVIQWIGCLYFRKKEKKKPWGKSLL